MNAAKEFAQEIRLSIKPDLRDFEQGATPYVCVCVCVRLYVYLHVQRGIKNHDLVNYTLLIITFYHSTPYRHIPRR